MHYILDPLSYIRGPLVTAFGVIHTLFFSVLTMTTAVLSGGSRRWIDRICVRPWSGLILWVAGVKVDIRGAEHLRVSGKGFLILFNHSSHIDIPILYRIPRMFNFGAKVELFKIPFFGKAMELCGVLPIDRGNRNKVMKVYENAIKRVEGGECFALAPEGTRQPEPRIGPFKRGPFEFAVNAGMDVVPVVIAGAYEVLPRKGIWINMGKWRRRVIVEVLPRVSTAGLNPDQLEPFVQTVRRQFEAAFQRNHAEVLAGR